MPIGSEVNTGDSGSGGVTVTGGVRDDGGTGGSQISAEVILSVENAKVTLVSVHPPFYKKRNANGHIQIWWKTDLKANKNWPFSVVLGCKNNANGPTIGALTVCSQNDTPPSKHRFHSRTFTFYHATHRCQKKYVLKKPNPRDFSNIPRPKLGSGGFSRK